MIQNQEPTMDTVGNMLITELLERWPQTADVFHDHAMACVGCAVASFYTVSDSTLVYGLSPELFIQELLAVIRSTAKEEETTDEREL